LCPVMGSLDLTRGTVVIELTRAGHAARHKHCPKDAQRETLVTEKSVSTRR
jgi:hypothetical protein